MTTTTELANALNGTAGACLCNETDGNRYCVHHGGTMPAKLSTIRAAVLAAKTQDAYSANVYRSWVSVARLLLSRKFTEREAEAIMRSKWTRWAADGYKGGRSSGVPASALADFLDNVIGKNTLREVEQLVAETFATTEN